MNQVFDFKRDIKAAKDRAAQTAVIEKLFLQIFDDFLLKIPDGLDLNEKYSRVCACITETRITAYREINKTSISQETKSFAVSIVTKITNFVFDDITKQYLGPFLKPESDKLTEITEFQKDTYLPVLSAKHYLECQEAISQKQFRTYPNTPYPTFLLSGGGFIQLRPTELENQLLLPPEQLEILVDKMFAQISKLSDRTADTFDIMTSNWIIQSGDDVNSRASGNLDRFLAMRGLVPKHKGRGKAFRKEQRQELLEDISLISLIWFDMGEVEIYYKDGKKTKKTKEFVRSRAFAITDTTGQPRFDGFKDDIQTIIYVPGTAFAHFILGVGRQVMQLSSMALKYDPYRQKPEKRLTRYLSGQWRIKAKDGLFVNSYQVETLLKAIGEDAISPAMIKNRPGDARRRLEKALETLEGLKLVNGELVRVKEEQVISGWQYKNWDESLTDKWGWFDAYRKTTITIEAPDLIKEHYRNISKNTQNRIAKATRKKAALPAPEPAASFNGLGEMLRTEISRREVTQLMVAEELGITPGYVSQIVNGLAVPAANLRDKIRAWLSEKS